MNKSRKDGLILQQKCSGEGNISSYLEFLTLALNKTQFLHFKWEGCDILCVYISYIYICLHIYVSEIEVMNLRESKGEVIWGWLSNFLNKLIR